MVSLFLDMSRIVPRSTDGGLSSRPTQRAAQNESCSAAALGGVLVFFRHIEIVLRRTGAPPRGAAIHGHVDDEVLCKSQTHLLHTVGGSAIHLLKDPPSARHNG